MKTIKEIMAEAKITTRQAFYYRLELSGIEEKPNYQPKYIYARGKPPKRAFTEEEATLLIHIFDKGNGNER